MKRWTAADDARLVQLYRHHSNVEIGRLLGCTEPAVLNRARKLAGRLLDGVEHNGYPDSGGTNVTEKDA